MTITTTLPVLRVSAETKPHPVYRYRAVYWGTVWRGDRPVFQIGPYRDKDQAITAAWAKKTRIEAGEAV